MDDLVIENKGLIYFVLNKMGLTYHLEEYYDIGEIGLIRASKTFDETKGNKFSGYASICIQYEISKYLSYKQRKCRKSGDNLISLDEVQDDNYPLYETIDSGINLEEDILMQEKINLLNTIIEILEHKDRYMLKHYFELDGFEKLTYKQIGDRLGLKQRYIEYRIKRALRIIKKIMENKGVVE